MGVVNGNRRLGFPKPPFWSAIRTWQIMYPLRTTDQSMLRGRLTSIKLMLMGLERVGSTSSVLLPALRVKVAR